MSKNYSVYKGPDGLWRGKRDGATRAYVVERTQQEAFKETRKLAKKSGGEVSIHRKDNGKIRRKHSYGNDPAYIPG